MFTGLGVFRLYFDFDWTAGEPSGQLFTLRVHGGSAFNLFEAEPFSGWFWLTWTITAVLLLSLPWFRPLGSLLLALLAVLAVLLVHWLAKADSGLAIEFELLVIALVFLLHVALSLYAEARASQAVTGLLQQYVPPSLAEGWRHGTGRTMPGDEQHEVSVMFCDIVNFSGRSEELQPAALAQWLNGFFELVSGIVVRHGGCIDKYIGDSVMAIWGVPEPCEDHARRAVAAAIEIQQELVLLSQHLERNGQPPISAGIGISTGQVNAGILGSQYRRDYTVVGDAVNVARRLESLTRRYAATVLVSERTVAALPEIAFEELDSIVLKGRRQPVAIHALSTLQLASGRLQPPA